MAELDQYAFVLNLFDHSGSLPMEIGPGLQLNRSTPGQSRRISEFLASYGAPSGGGPWLYQVEPIERAQLANHSFVPLQRDQQKFWVLNFAGDHMPIWRFGSATQLTDAELEIAATFNPKQGDSIQVLEPARIFHFWEQHRFPIKQEFSVDDLRQSVNYRDRLEALAKSEVPAEQAVAHVYSDFIKLSLGPRSGELVLLGHFGLIEALITHDPHAFGDSLNHQLSTKLPLLMRRFSAPLNVEEYFAKMEPKKVWKKLYGIRSTIAHGGRVDIRPGALGELRDVETVFRFVRQTLKRLLIFAMYEPQFVFDLKAC